MHDVMNKIDQKLESAQRKSMANNGLSQKVK
jgi:hypothetical protein